MRYHKFKFGLRRNIKVLLCRMFGHRLNETPGHFWCERCSLCYEECYGELDWWMSLRNFFKRVRSTQTTDFPEDLYVMDYNKFIKEIAIRTHLSLPTTEEELKMWDEGTDYKLCGDFVQRLDAELQRDRESIY